jgi:hypothetical protein
MDFTLLLSTFRKPKVQLVLAGILVVAIVGYVIYRATRKAKFAFKPAPSKPSISSIYKPVPAPIYKPVPVPVSKPIYTPYQPYVPPSMPPKPMGKPVINPFYNPIYYPQGNPTPNNPNPQRAW